MTVWQDRIGPSRICLGTVSFGSDISRTDAFALLDRYAALGGNFIDTAHVYSLWEPEGEGASERTIGEWIRAHGARDSVVLATKGGHPPLDRMDAPRCSAKEFENDLSESLDRLGVDSVDLYWVHRDDPRRPAGEILEALAGCVRDGRVRLLGVSNWSVARILEANAYGQSHDLPLFCASQPRWALADRVNELPASDNTLDLDAAGVDWHRRTGFPLVPFTAQAKGYFGAENVAWAKNGFAGEPPRGSRYDGPANRLRLLSAMEMANNKGVTAHQIALAYLLNQPVAVYPIIGTRDVHHLGEALAAMTIRLSPEECSRLENGTRISVK